MKATCIVGSARSNGSTAYLIDTIMRGMTDAGMQARKYCIGDADIRYCLGCKRCSVDGKCVHRDDVAGIVSDILDSDVVVIAAPSYWAGVPGQLKTFFDRNTPYCNTDSHQPMRARGVAVAVRAGVRPQENALILDSIEHYFGHLGIETVRRISVCETGTLEDLKAKHADVIDGMYALGRELAGSSK